MPEVAFKPAWFARGPHAQTILGRILRPSRLVPLQREIIETPDGDELVLDHLPGSPPRFLLLHGLEGSSYSAYIQGVLSIVARRGISATAINFRSCARDPRNVLRSLPNRRHRLYHSGETGDFDFIVRALHARTPGIRLAAFGASLGGNVLLKWLGENPEQSFISAAATVSVPFDLAAAAKHLEKGLGRFYVKRFLTTMYKKFRDVAARSPQSALDLKRAKKARTFHEFDSAATAPLHGFKDATDYYTQSSSLQYLAHITTPTLCINSEDDPFLPREALERARAAASPAVQFIVTKAGGHVGFISGRFPWRSVYWAEELVVDWLTFNIGA